MKTLALLNHGRDGSPLPSLIKSGTRTESRPYLHKESAGGMVLFEVMIALFVFTMAAFSLVVALSGCLDAAAQRNQVDIALHGLSNQLALLHGSSIQPGETDAPDDGDGRGLSRLGLVAAGPARPEGAADPEHVSRDDHGDVEVVQTANCRRAMSRS